MSNIIFKWLPGTGEGLPSADAQMVGDALTKIHKKHGHLKPQIVIAEAKSKRSQLHEFFEWDDAVAADAHRREQARYMMRHIVVLEPGDEIGDSMRAFVHITDEDDKDVYIDIKVAMGDEALRKQVLERAWKELQSWRRRYKQYEELAAVFAAMDSAA